jgi:hypothetical protein
MGGGIPVPEELQVGCERPDIEQPQASNITVEEEKKQNMIKIGKPAPDFKAPGFYQGKFMSTSLSDYKGKWVLLCFYPGDFTFV